MATATKMRTIVKLSDVQVKGIYGRLENIAKWASEPTPSMVYCSDSEIREQISSLFPQKIDGCPARVSVKLGKNQVGLANVTVTLKIRVSTNHVGTPLTKRRVIPGNTLGDAPLKPDFLSSQSFAFNRWVGSMFSKYVPGAKTLMPNEYMVTGTVDTDKPGNPVNIDLAIIKSFFRDRSRQGSLNFTRADVYDLARLVLVNMLIQA